MPNEKKKCKSKMTQHNNCISSFEDRLVFELKSAVNVWHNKIGWKSDECRFVFIFV